MAGAWIIGGFIVAFAPNAKFGQFAVGVAIILLATGIGAR